ncbi:unnamed protein product, partial [Linum tenue]
MKEANLRHLMEDGTTKWPQGDDSDPGYYIVNFILGANKKLGRKILEGVFLADSLFLFE